MGYYGQKPRFWAFWPKIAIFGHFSEKSPGSYRAKIGKFGQKWPKSPKRLKNPVLGTLGIPGEGGFTSTPPAGRSRGPRGPGFRLPCPRAGPGGPEGSHPGPRDPGPRPLRGSGRLREAPESPPGLPGPLARGCFTSTPRGGAPRYPPGPGPGIPTPRSVESLQAAAGLEREVVGISR